MPLQTYRPQSPSVGSSFVKGWTTGENIKSQRFQNALGADRNAIAGQRTALAEKQNTRQQEKWEGEQGKIGRELAFGFANSLDYTSEENFLKSILGAIEPMGQKAVDALGDTTAAADIIMQMKAMRDLMLPGGRKDAPVKQEIKRAMNYMQHLKNTLGEKKEPDYKEGETRTFQKGRQKITQEYKNGKWVELGKGSMDAPDTKKGFKQGDTRTVQVKREKITQEFDGKKWVEIGRGGMDAAGKPEMTSLQAQKRLSAIRSSMALFGKNDTITSNMQLFLAADPNVSEDLKQLAIGSKIPKNLKEAAFAQWEREMRELEQYTGNVAPPPDPELPEGENEALQMSIGEPAVAAAPPPNALAPEQPGRHVIYDRQRGVFVAK